MKITDQGLNQILSLGLLKPLETPGVFYLYTWREVNYYCGLPLYKNSLKEEGIFISLTEEQYKTLPVKTNKPSKNSELIKISKYFETAVHMAYDSNSNTLNTTDYNGPNSRVSSLQISLDSPSPFTVIKETLKGFHGFYSSIEPCDTYLEKAYLQKESLWISASPIIKDGNFIGVIAGLSNGKEYGLDALDVLDNFALKAS